MATPRANPARAPGLTFDVRVEHGHEQSPRPDTVLDVFVRVDATPATPAPGGAGPGREAGPRYDDFAVVVAVDLDADRADTARAALADTLRALPTGCSFALLGADGRTAYPFDGGWAVAGPGTLAEAAFTAAARHVYVDRRAWGPGSGGAGVAGLLAAARAQFALGAGRVPPVRHLLLVTDGSGGPGPGPATGPTAPSGPPPGAVGGGGGGWAAGAAGGARRVGGEGPAGPELRLCAGRFSCDVLVLDGDWDPPLLLAVAEHLHGTAQPVPDRFEAAAARLLDARHGAAPELPLELALRRGVRLVDLVETDPGQYSLPVLPDQDSPGVLRTPAYPWHPGSRSYLLRLGVDATADPLATDLQLAVLAVGGTRTPVVVRWETRPRARPTPLPSPSGRTRSIDELVGPGAGEAGARPYGVDENTVVVAGAVEQMRKELKRGKIALHNNRRESAEHRLGAAVQLAHQLGVDWALAEVRRLADIEDARLGLVRVHEAVDRDELKRSILHREGAATAVAATAEAAFVAALGCPYCGHRAGAQARYCIRCGEELAGARR